MSIKLGNAEVNAISIIEPYGSDITSVYPDTTSEWSRPSYWPEMPVINSGEHKANFLIRIASGINGPESLTNYFKFTAYSQQIHPYRHYDFDIDWGDGQSERINHRAGLYDGSGTYTHDYDFNDLSPDTQFTENGIGYRIALVQIESPLSGINDFNWRYVKNYPGGNVQYQGVDNCLEFDIHLPSAVSVGVNYQGSYLAFPSLEKAKLYAPKVQYLDSYFQSTSRLKSLELGEFDNLVSIDGMFAGSALESLPEIDMSNVTTASQAFSNMHNITEYNNNYDFSSLTNAPYLFSGCKNLRKVHIDISSNVTSFLQAFAYCRNLVHVSGNWDTSNVTSFQDAFSYCNLVYPPDLDFSSATSIHGIFEGCGNLRKAPVLNCPNVIDAESAFRYCRSIREIVIEDMSASNALNFNYMFQNCINLRRAIIKRPISASSFQFGFSGCSNLRKVSYIDLSGCSNAGSLFNSCNSLVYGPEMNTSTLTSFQSMFQGCNNLVSVPDYDITCGGIGNVNIGYMFKDSSLQTIPNFDWSRVSFAHEAFKCAASGDISLDLSNLNYNTSASASAAQYIFRGCKNLSFKDLTLSESGNYQNTFAYANLVSFPYVSASGGYNYSGMFNYTTELQKGALSGVDKSIGYYRTHLSSGAILDVFNGLASGVTAQTIDLRQAPSAYILHPDTIAIATSKGWTVTT